MSTVPIGLAVVVSDLAPSAQFIPTVTGIATADTAAGFANGDLFSIPLPVTAVSVAAEATLAQLVAVASANPNMATPGSLTCRGFLIGTLLGDPFGTPAGATVTVNNLLTGAAADASVYYFDTAAAAANPALLLTGTQTDSTGSYLVVNNANSCVTATPSFLTVEAQNEASAVGGAPSGLSPGFATVQYILAAL